MKRFLALLLFCTGLARGESSPPQEYYDPAVQVLIHADSLTFGGGLSGLSQGEIAFGQIVRKKEAIRYILAAFEYGNPQGQCYALIALRESSEPLFRAALAAVRKNPPKTTIPSYQGCFVRQLAPYSVYADIEVGAYASAFKSYEAKR